MATFYCNGETSYKTMLMLIFCLFSPCLTNSTNRTCPPDGLHGETNVDSTQYDDHFEDANRYWQFGSKSVYNLENTFPPVPSGCTPKQIFMIIRHGTRLSSSNCIKKMAKLTDLISKMDKPKMNEKDVEELKNWEITSDGTIDRNISDQGISDMIGLGQRVRATFKNLFDEPYDSANRMYKVVSASKSRCTTSAQKFMEAVLGVEHIENFLKTIDLDVLPNLYELKTQLGGTADESQKNCFKQSDTVANVLTRVAEKMGLEKGVITLEQLDTMYEACRHARATDTTSTPIWCKVFSEQDLKVMEYMDDLGWYYSFGYGCPLHEKFTCPLLKQLIDSFRNKVNGNGPNGVFSFAHRSNQIVTTVMLGAAKDEQPLTCDNMDEMEDRKWKTSKLNPFGANITAVLYKCDNKDMKVSFYINEAITPIDLGNGQKCELCPWELVQKKFGDEIRINCDNNFCN